MILKDYLSGKAGVVLDAHTNKGFSSVPIGYGDADSDVSRLGMLSLEGAIKDGSWVWNRKGRLYGNGGQKITNIIARIDHGEWNRLIEIYQD